MTAPVLGDRVLYTLSTADATQIDSEFPLPPPFINPQPRNPVAGGEQLPATVVAVHGDGTVNLQVHLDGIYQFWATNRVQGTVPGTWQ